MAQLGLNERGKEESRNSEREKSVIEQGMRRGLREGCNGNEVRSVCDEVGSSNGN